ncbi:MAG: hypothetical protein CMQ05_12460 [Gammaproteobacteria bacterium]|nr:hypothetical protein [Gammaproteobacteria bacterium]RPG25184.1 MAG: hypothetical protein CBC10_008700 [Gammaproteobacteria bacterium TMED50]
MIDQPNTPAPRHRSKKVLPQSLLSGVSLAGVTINLLCWLAPLILVSLLLAILRLIPGDTLQLPRRALYDATDRIYRWAVTINNYWLYRVTDIPLVIHGETPTDPDEPLIVVSNHRSWFDILAAQAIITSAGPRINFLVKQNLVWVPIVGWICLALNFPLLKRGGQETREQDRLAIARSLNLQRGDDRRIGAMLTFVEGTRFTAQKQTSSPWLHVLPPRKGGLTIIRDLIAPARVADLTIIYPGDSSFWELLSGRTAPIHVHIDWRHTADMTDLSQWLQDTWERKDARIAHYVD